MDRRNNSQACLNKSEYTFLYYHLLSCFITLQFDILSFGKINVTSIQSLGCIDETHTQHFMCISFFPPRLQTSQPNPSYWEQIHSRVQGILQTHKVNWDHPNYLWPSTDPSTQKVTNQLRLNNQDCIHCSNSCFNNVYCLFKVKSRIGQNIYRGYGGWHPWAGLFCLKCPDEN